MNRSLVSIIIPTYNRATLLPETLDSILAQTYSYWECIVVDDGSTDDSKQVLATYAQKDVRIRYYDRPDSLVKGANSCRNFGLSKSKGAYINFFDSDDIMLPEFLNEKVALIRANPFTDFVISRTVNFTESDVVVIDKYNQNSEYPLDLKNFLNGNVYWMTPDMLIKREALHQTRFDETLKSAQEANFFIKLLSLNDLSGIYVQSVLTKRRIHQNSIQQLIKYDPAISRRQRLNSLINAYFDVYSQLDKQTNIVYQAELITSFYNLVRKNYPYLLLFRLTPYLFRHKGVIKTITFLSIIFSQSLFGISGYRCLDYIRS